MVHTPAARPRGPGRRDTWCELRRYGSASYSAVAVRFFPPKMEEKLPAALFPRPPLTEDQRLLALFSLPPPTHDSSAPLAVFSVPPLTESPWPMATLPLPPL